MFLKKVSRATNIQLRQPSTPPLSHAASITMSLRVCLVSSLVYNLFIRCLNCLIDYFALWCVCPLVPLPLGRGFRHTGSDRVPQRDGDASGAQPSCSHRQVLLLLRGGGGGASCRTRGTHDPHWVRKLKSLL